VNIFRYDQKEVRTHEAEGQAWFCLNDVARVLEIAQPKHFLSSEWCDKEGVRSTDTLTPGGVQTVTFINEGNLYTLVGRSRKPGAIAFTKWVNHEVLPALRKTGRYEVEQRDAASDPVLMQLELIRHIRNDQLALERRVAAIEARQEAVLEQVDALPAPTAEVRELTTRELLRQAVETYVGLTGLGFQEAWRKVYRAYDYQKGVCLTTRAKTKKIGKLEWLERHGDLDTAYAIAVRMIEDVKRAVAA